MYEALTGKRVMDFETSTARLFDVVLSKDSLEAIEMNNELLTLLKASSSYPRKLIEKKASGRDAAALGNKRAMARSARA